MINENFIDKVIHILLEMRLDEEPGRKVSQYLYKDAPPKTGSTDRVNRELRSAMRGELAGQLARKRTKERADWLKAKEQVRAELKHKPKKGDVARKRRG